MTPETAAPETEAEETAEPETETGEETTEVAGEEETESKTSSGDSDGMMTMQLFDLSDDEGEVGIAAASLGESKVADTSRETSTPISLDGDFSDWETRQGTEVHDGLLSKMDMIWAEDGGLYIYLEEKDGKDGAVAGNIGNWNDGRYVITSDTGRQMVFILKANENTGECWLQDADGNKFTDVELVYVPGKYTYTQETGTVKTGGKYEIKIPASMIKSYNQSVSLGYYLSDNQKIVSDVANPYLETPAEDTNVNAIVFDGNTGDWDHVVGQELIEYSTDKADAEAKLLTDDNTNILNVFVQVYKKGQYQKCFNFFELAVNGDFDHQIGFQLLALGDDGYLHPIGKLNDGTPGTYTYYIGGIGLNCAKSGEIWGYDGTKINLETNDPNRPILGKMFLTVDATGKVSTESQLDLDKISYYMGVSADNMKEVDMRWIRIGDKWISAAGTSTGPIPGILMGVGVVAFAAWGMKKKEEDLPKTTED